MPNHANHYQVASAAVHSIYFLYNFHGDIQKTFWRSLWVNEGNKNYTKLGGGRLSLFKLFGGNPSKSFLIFAFFLLMETFVCLHGERKELVKQERYDARKNGHMNSWNGYTTFHCSGLSHLSIPMKNAGQVFLFQGTVEASSQKRHKIRSWNLPWKDVMD